MAEVNKVVYIVVVDDGENKGEKGEEGKESFRYTRSVLQSTLQVMGCKARHAFKISKRVFEIVKGQSSSGLAAQLAVFGLSNTGTKPQDSLSTSNCLVKSQVNNTLVAEKDGSSRSLSSKLYRMRTTLFVPRAKFLDVICDALSEYKYVGPNQREDLILACRIREKKESVTVLLCGTSGCGKSTLSSLLGSRLGITTVISTDSIRHMMRSFVDEKQNPLLWASTYQAGECLDPTSVAEAKAKKKIGITQSFLKEGLSDSMQKGKSNNQKPETSSNNAELVSPKQMAIEGFKAQSEMVIESLDRLITAWEERKESVIVEGVHLSLNFVMGLMKKHPSIVPFMIYISNEEKHMERFAVRAKYMTLHPMRNKYVKYIRNIRAIQEYLCNRADKHLVPKINNTNVDKSVAAIHATLFSCLQRRQAGEQLYDPTTNTVNVVHEEYRNKCAADSLNSEGMFQLIQRQGSSRQLMALVNNDGSVAKAWPVNSADSNDKPVLGHGPDRRIGTPMYGPLQISKAEPVNLQFGHFGISAWPSDTGGTSHASSVDESWTGTETGSRCHSSCSSSPRMSDGAAKELKEELSVYGSDDDIDDPLEVDSDQDLTDDELHSQEEIEGSVDEESTKLDDEYEDLAMQDDQEKGYWSDGEEELLAHGDISTSNNEGDKLVQAPLDMFLRTKSEPLSEQLCSYSSMLVEKIEKKISSTNNARMRKRSLSIPAFRKRDTVAGSILSGAPEKVAHQF